MTTSSRDRISVDLRGLGVRLHAQTDALGISPSAFVRRALADQLARLDDDQHEGAELGATTEDRHRARLCLRMSAARAALLVDAARMAGMSNGAYVEDLVAGVPVIVQGDRQDHIRALRDSTAEMATLSRNVHRLSDLLRQGDLQQARPYREMLNRLTVDVRAHLQIAALVLAGLAPAGRRLPCKSASSV